MTTSALEIQLVEWLTAQKNVTDAQPMCATFYDAVNRYRIQQFYGAEYIVSGTCDASHPLVLTNNKKVGDTYAYHHLYIGGDPSLLEEKLNISIHSHTACFFWQYGIPGDWFLTYPHQQVNKYLYEQHQEFYPFGRFFVLTLRNKDWAGGEIGIPSLRLPMTVTYADLTEEENKVGKMKLKMQETMKDLESIIRRT